MINWYRKRKAPRVVVVVRRESIRIDWLISRSNWCSARLKSMLRQKFFVFLLLLVLFLRSDSKRPKTSDKCLNFKAKTIGSIHAIRNGVLDIIDLSMVGESIPLDVTRLAPWFRRRNPLIAPACCRVLLPQPGAEFIQPCEWMDSAIWRRVSSRDPWWGKNFSTNRSLSMGAGNTYSRDMNSIAHIMNWGTVFNSFKTDLKHIIF